MPNLPFPLNILLMLALIGFCVWLILKFIPMPEPWRSAFVAIAAILTLFWLLGIFAPRFAHGATCIQLGKLCTPPGQAGNCCQEPAPMTCIKKPGATAKCALGTPPVTVTSTTRPSGTTTTTLPPRAAIEPRAVSIKIDAQEACAWLRTWPTPDGPPTYRQADQVDRAMMVDSYIGRFVPQAINAAWQVPSCTALAAKESKRPEMGEIWARLAAGYKGRGLGPSTGGTYPKCAVWTEQINCHVYSIPQKVLVKLRACLLNAPQCVAVMGMSQALLDVMDMRIDGSRCFQGAYFDLGTPPQGQWSTTLEDEGAIKTCDVQPLTLTQQALLDATHQCHHNASFDIPSDCNTKALHRAFVESGRTRTEQRRFGIGDFSGAIYGQGAAYGKHPDGWTDDEVRIGKALQDYFHAEWAKQVKAGNWSLSERASIDHQNTHVLMNLPPDTDAQFLFSCFELPDGSISYIPDATSRPAYIDDCLRLSSREALWTLAPLVAQ